MDTNKAIESFRRLINDKVYFSIPNIYLFGNKGLIESDLVAMTKGGYFVEYEFKISRSDFLAEKRKGKWKEYSLHYDKAPKHFIYIVPENSVEVSEIPSYAGLIYFDKHYNFLTIKKPLTLNRKKPIQDDVIKVLRKFYFKDLDIYYNPKVFKRFKTA